MGFKGRALLPRRLLKDPELLLSMPSRVPETPALTRSQNLLFPPSEQEFKPETHLRLPQPEATRSRDRLSLSHPHRSHAPVHPTGGSAWWSTNVQKREPRQAEPLGLAAAPPAAAVGASPLLCTAMLPAPPHITPHHPHPHELGPRLNTSHYARFSCCPDECLHLFGAAAPGEKQRCCASPASPRAVPHPYSSERAAPPAQRRALGPRGRGRGGCSHSSPRREGIKP